MARDVTTAWRQLWHARKVSVALTTEFPRVFPSFERRNLILGLAMQWSIIVPMNDAAWFSHLDDVSRVVSPRSLEKQCDVQELW